MNPQVAEIRDTVLLATAIVLGVAMASVLPLVGLPMAAAGITGLYLERRLPWLFFAIGLGVLASAVIEPLSVLYVVPAVAAVFLAVVLLPRMSYQAVAAGVIAILGLAAGGFDAAVARSNGTTLAASMAKEAGILTAGVLKAMGSSATPDAVAQVKELANTLVMALPSSYFTQAFFVGVVVIAVIAWVSNRRGRPVEVPPLSHVDLTPHVLWLFIVGLLMLAAGHASFASALTVRAIGLNLVLSVHVLFALQGLGVAAGVLDRTRVGRGVRIFALAALVALDTVTLAVSFIGLLDFWFNFRRLPRDGASPSSPTDTVSDRL
jgi:hypothetical protein